MKSSSLTGCFDVPYWDMVWQRPYYRYNRHHSLVWSCLLPLLKGKVCDLGCGACMMYKDSSIDLTGVDFSSAALAEAQKNYPSGRYVLSDIRHVPIADKIFDTVILSGVLDYYEQWDDFIIEAKRISRGKVYATLLDKWRGRSWKDKYVHLHGNWYLAQF